MIYLLIVFFGVNNRVPNYSIKRIKVLVTSFCNLNCNHCYQYFEKNQYCLSKAELFRIIDFACSKKTQTLDFSGGEFFTHPNAYEILDYCFSKQIMVNIATNALTLNTDYFNKFIDTNVLSIQISIDGMKNNHDLRRGNGTWDKAIANAKTLYSYGIPLTANMTLDTDNYTDVLDVLELPYFSFCSFTPVAYAGAATLHSSHSLVEFEDTLRYVYRNLESGTESFSDTIFPNNLAIKYDGSVYISPIACDYNLFCLGNIKETSLENICDSFTQSLKYKSLIEISSDTIEECNNCPANNTCDRGCRFRAYKFFGELLKPDPFCCWIYSNKYNDIPVAKLFWGTK